MESGTRAAAISQVIDTVASTAPRGKYPEVDQELAHDPEPRSPEEAGKGGNSDVSQHNYYPPTARQEGPPETTQPSPKPPLSPDPDQSPWKDKAYDCLDVAGQWGVYALLCPVATVGIICCPAHFDDWWRRHMA